LSWLQNHGVENPEIIAETGQLLNKVVTHPELQSFFDATFHVNTERDMVDESGSLLRPDRLMFKEDEVYIIEYKTGMPDKTHEDQVKTYADVLRKAGYQVKEAFLVYLSENIEVKRISVFS
ncbi:MAG: PD-(D/E)XK nuclease family protein, partial [Bacteroidota bacterium]